MRVNIPLLKRKLMQVMTTVFAAAVITLPIANASTFSVLHNFTGNTNDGSQPKAGLARDSSGNLFGTTTLGGAHAIGVAFEIDSSGTFSVLHSFAGGSSDGSTPLASLAIDSSGDLYGTTELGGTSNKGVVFEIDSGGTFSVLHSFTGGSSDGSTPLDGLIRDSSGNLYGTTEFGGSSNKGVAFKITSGGTFSILHTFLGGTTDGDTPWAGLIRDSSGNLYGTTTAGGAHGDGVVFKVTSAGTFSILHSFAGGTTDGATPLAPLVLDASGNLYGTTESGGAHGDGIVFKTTSTGTTTILHSFAGGSTDGATPLAGLARDASGNLYGTTEFGGTSADGVLFEVASGGTFSVLHSFGTGTGNGATPWAGAILDGSGNLYGTTFMGGSSARGVVYEFTP